MPEAVIIDAVRTPIGNFRGGLASIRPDDLAAIVLKAIVERTGIDPRRGAQQRRARLRRFAQWVLYQERS